MDDSGSRITELPLASVAGAKRPVSEPGHHGVEWHGGDKGEPRKKYMKFPIESSVSFSIG